MDSHTLLKIAIMRKLELEKEAVGPLIPLGARIATMLPKATSFLSKVKPAAKKAAGYARQAGSYVIPKSTGGKAAMGLMMVPAVGGAGAVQAQGGMY